MGSMIVLSVGNLEIDWGKNFYSSDHSQLFQPCDLTQVPYYYADRDTPNTEEEAEYEYDLRSEMKDGLSKPLEQVIERLDLLGYTMNCARRDFEHCCRLSDFDSNKFSFCELAVALATIDVISISADYGEGESIGKFFMRHLFNRLGLEGIVDDPEYVRSHAGEAMENLSAHTILRLLAQNPKAKGLSVNWQIADIEEAGWATRDNLIGSVYPENRFLIVTEGSLRRQNYRTRPQPAKVPCGGFFRLCRYE